MTGFLRIREPVELMLKLTIQLSPSILKEREVSMKKTLFTLLTLILALALLVTAVSCEVSGSVEQKEEESSATEIIRDKTAASGESLTEAEMNEVVKRNETVITEAEPFIKDIEALFDGKGSSTISSAKIDIVIRPQNDSSTFTVATADEYTKAKDYIKSVITQSGGTADESRLVPGEYSLIQVELDYIGKSSRIQYRTAGSSELKTCVLSDFTSPLTLDMMALSYNLNGSGSDGEISMEMLMKSIDPLLAAAAKAPKATFTFVLTDNSNTTYTAVLSSGISLSGRKIITVDEISLKKGDTELATLKCRTSLKISDDFSYTAPLKEGDEAVMKGTIDISIDSIELNVGKGKFVLSAKLAATLDFTNKKATLYAALSEKIGNDTIFDIEAGLKEVSDIPGSLDKITLYKCNILGKSYSSESAIKVISGMLNGE